jgi:hypothetical protein
VDVLRVGATASVVGHDTVAASAVGTWLRPFTFGDVLQLDKVAETTQARAGGTGAWPGDWLLTMHIDSTIFEVLGRSGASMQGAAYGYTTQLGLHPLVAIRVDKERGFPRPHPNTVTRIR